VIVVDASVLADALVDDGPVGDEARAVLQDDVHWVAPAHLVAEVVSVIRGRVLGGKLDNRRGGDALNALQELTIESIDLMGLVDRMWELRDNLTPYDAAYVASAESLGCPLVTADARLGRVRGLRCPINLVGPTVPDRR
jgi:predicted nucleic acid-binding protein